MTLALLQSAALVFALSIALWLAYKAFDRLVPTHWLRERHDFALASVMTLPVVFALSLRARAPEALPSETATGAALGAEPAAAARTTLEGVRNAFQPAPSTQPETGLIIDWSAAADPLAMLGLSVWIGVSLFLLLRLGRDLVALSQLRRQSRQIAAPAGLVLSREVELRVSDRIRSPMIVGYIWHVILLPRGFRFDAQAPAVLEHEIAHLERRDAWTVLLLRVIGAVFWWAVPLRLLVPAISRAREALCDRRAAVITNNPHQLAHALLDNAERAVKAPALALSAHAKGSVLAERIQHLVSPHATQKKDTPMRMSLILPAMTAVAIIATPSFGAISAVEGNRADNEWTERSDADLPLYRAARRGRLAQVQTMLDAGADPNAVSQGDGTALMAAVRGGHEDVVAELLSRGADPDLAVQGDGSALIVAADRGERGIVRMLLDADADPNLGVSGDGNPLITASREGDARTVDMLMEAGANPNGEVQGDGNPLIGASLGGHTGIVSTLLEAGADPNGYVWGDETPLINAAQRGEIQVAELLLEAGADISLTVEAPTRSGTTVYRSPLSEARRNGHDGMVRWLEARGAEHRPPAE